MQIEGQAAIVTGGGSGLAGCRDLCDSASAALAAHTVNHVHSIGETIRLDGALRMAPR
jgi:hypothetical protein